MKIQRPILALIILLISLISYSQSYPRMGNPNYATTELIEDFNGSFDGNIWKIFNNQCFNGPNETPILSWVNNTTTVHQDNGNLNLSARAYDNYTGCGTSVDFISGQVASRDNFHYGIFECSATFDYEHGSFPAFWLNYEIDCNVSHRAEIDIVEMKYKHSNPTLDNIHLHTLNNTSYKFPDTRMV